MHVCAALFSSFCDNMQLFVFVSAYIFIVISFSIRISSIGSSEVLINIWGRIPGGGDGGDTTN